MYDTPSVHGAVLISYLAWICFSLALVGSAYCVTVAAALPRVLARRPPTANQYPPVTLLKPLHTPEPGLAERLASFCAQDYPAPVQIIFGLADGADRAADIVRDLRVDNTRLEIDLVVDPRTHGANLKVSNVINMMARAKYPLLVLSDSDIEVAPDYLRGIVDALAESNVGAVTCLYHGISKRGFWPDFAAMGISYQFLPNAAFGIASRLATPCFGATIALTRKTLNEIGGFEAFADTLADDYEIGRAVRKRGHRVALSPTVVGHFCTEDSVRAMLMRELRWGRTIRNIDRRGYVGSVITNPVPWALMSVLLRGFAGPAGVMLVLALAARAIVKSKVDASLGASGGWWLLPLRDCVSFGVFVASLWGACVEWRGARLRVRADGVLSRR